VPGVRGEHARWKERNGSSPRIIAAADAAAAAARAALGLTTEIRVTFYATRAAAEQHAPGKEMSLFERGSVKIIYTSKHHHTVRPS